MARVIVLGGHGNFGTRICSALRSTKRFDVIAAGRGQRADLRLEITDRYFAGALREARPDIVIHCVGPFQAQDYAVAHAVLSAGAHYVDLADGRRFVSDFAKEVDGAARKVNRLAVSGASTLPALSSAVVDALSIGLSRLDAIQIVIAPGQRAPRGDATLKAVFSYCGKRFKWLVNGQWENAYGWQELTTIRIDRLGSRFAAACDVPDLELFPARYSGVRTVQFRASLEIAFLHWALWLIAGLRRVGMPLPIEQFAPALNARASWLDHLGGPFGGMLVHVAGIDSGGRSVRFEWHLSVDAVVGPEIPCLAAILMTQKLAEQRIDRVGAYPCIGFLTLDEFRPEFQSRNITTSVKQLIE